MWVSRPVFGGITMAKYTDMSDDCASIWLYGSNQIGSITWVFEDKAQAARVAAAINAALPEPVQADGPYHDEGSV